MVKLFNGYQAVVSTASTRIPRPISADYVANLENKLDELAGIMGDKFNWVLTGGLSIPLSLGEFYRQHDDIDIGLDEVDLPAFSDRLQGQGYDLFLRPIMFKISPHKKVDIYRRSTPESIKVFSNTRVRAVRVNASGEIALNGDILDYFDVYAHHCINGDLFSRDERIRIPISAAFGSCYTSISGKKIFLRGKDYIRRLKFQKLDETNLLDLQYLENIKD